MRTFDIHPPDQSLAPTIREKIDNLNKPKGSLGRLEELALQIGLIQGSLTPSLHRPCHLLFGADHGIEREGVSVSPRNVTWQQMLNFANGGGGVNMFCRQHGFALTLVDMGVDHDLSGEPRIWNRKVAEHGTNSFLDGPAMNSEQFDKAIETGAAFVDKCRASGCNILSIGEMGIGNTSPSSIWMSLLCHIPLNECIGIGAGLDAAGVDRKRRILHQAVQHYQVCHQAISPIRYFGGFEMIGAIGAILRAAEQKMIVLVDGFIMSACMLAASHLYPAVLSYAIFAHAGNEQGHLRMLRQMKAEPLLNLGLRLGEGTGALCAYPIVDSAIRMIIEMNNFQNANIDKYF